LAEGGISARWRLHSSLIFTNVSAGVLQTMNYG
jgi:hypothetical protein